MRVISKAILVLAMIGLLVLNSSSLACAAHVQGGGTYVTTPSTKTLRDSTIYSRFG
jgi:hypothetical protein